MDRLSGTWRTPLDKFPIIFCIFHFEGEFIEIDVVRLHLSCTVKLIVHGDAAPRRRGWRFFMVDAGCLAVQSDGFKQQLIVRGSLDDEGQMVPCAADRITGNAGCHPLLTSVVVDVPLMAARDPAFVSPDELLAIYKLIDIEFHRLRNTGV